MAGPTLCVSCANLPIKDRDTATTLQRCPECQSDVGATSYGAHFRVRPTKAKPLAMRGLVQGVTLGAGIFSLVLILVGMGFWSTSTVKPARGPADRGNPVDPGEPPPPHEFARVREVSLHDPILADGAAKARQLDMVRQAREANSKKPDGFLRAQLDIRKEIRGLPFIMGDACKMPRDKSVTFERSVTAVRSAMDQDTQQSSAKQNPNHFTFWTSYTSRAPDGGIQTEAGIAALAQILGPEHNEFRIGMVRQLANSPKPEASRVLAKAAIFDRSGETRQAALKALKDRPHGEYNDILMHGLRYPLAVVARRSAQAMIALGHIELIPDLVAFLGEAAPGDPEVTTVDNAPAHVVRELVRVNHHRNCMLCHAPTETGQSFEVPAVMPTPGQPIAQTSQEYYGERRAQSEPSVRADTTYLRQDFSEMMPIANAHPWPTMQRYDFLVRTRVVEGKELAQLQSNVKGRAADFQSENHRAAVRVLRELTGQNAGPTQVAWQRVIERR